MMNDTFLILIPLKRSDTSLCRDTDLLLFRAKPTYLALGEDFHIITTQCVFCCIKIHFNAKCFSMEFQVMGFNRKKNV